MRYRVEGTFFRVLQLDMVLCSECFEYGNLLESKAIEVGVDPDDISFKRILPCEPIEDTWCDECGMPTYIDPLYECDYCDNDVEPCDLCAEDKRNKAAYLLVDRSGQWGDGPHFTLACEAHMCTDHKYDPAPDAFAYNLIPIGDVEK